MPWPGAVSCWVVDGKRSLPSLSPSPGWTPGVPNTLLQLSGAACRQREVLDMRLKLWFMTGALCMPFVADAVNLPSMVCREQRVVAIKQDTLTSQTYDSSSLYRFTPKGLYSQTRIAPNTSTTKCSSWSLI